MTRPRITAHDLARTNATEYATYPPRIKAALEQLERAADPYRTARTGPGPINGISDPAGIALTDPAHGAEQAKAARHALIRSVIDLDRTLGQLAAILSVWAPVQAKPLYCENHQRYGRNVPRSSDGSRDCAWCCHITREYGQKPNAELIRLKAGRERVSEADIRAALSTGKNLPRVTA